MAISKIKTTSTAFNDETGSLNIPVGTTAQRPSSPVNGMIRYNNTLNVTEEYRDGEWHQLSNIFTAEGGTVTTFDNFKVHTFTSSGTFTVTSGTAQVEYLVVAGGGAGGRCTDTSVHGGGGGGAGGYRCSVTGENSGANSSAEAKLSVTTGSYTVIVGSGGAGLVVETSETTGRYFPTWHSGDLINHFSSGGVANSYHVSEPFHAVSSANGTPLPRLTNSTLSLEFDAVRAGAGASFGFFLDTKEIKTFIIRANLVDNVGCRFVVRCFDASGNLLVDNPFTGSLGSGIGNTWVTTFGGGYGLGSDVFRATAATFSAAVAYAQIILIGGTNAMRIRSLSVTSLDADGPPRVYSGIARQPTASAATANPEAAGTLGRYAQGDFVANANAASGAPSGWTATNTGRLAPTWAPSTNYIVNFLRENGGNIYVCTVAGISAASGGPSGTGTGIVDGTATWDYVSPKATFAANANLA
jgi:hypothetical protein